MTLNIDIKSKLQKLTSASENETLIYLGKKSDFENVTSLDFQDGNIEEKNGLPTLPTERNTYLVACIKFIEIQKIFGVKSTKQINQIVNIEKDENIEWKILKISTGLMDELGAFFHLN